MCHQPMLLSCPAPELQPPDFGMFHNKVVRGRGTLVIASTKWRILTRVTVRKHSNAILRAFTPSHNCVVSVLMEVLHDERYCSLGHQYALDELRRREGSYRIENGKRSWSVWCMINMPKLGRI